MSAQQKPEQTTEPGMAVTRQQKLDEREGRMTPAQRAELQKVRADNALVMTITEESWGQKLTHNQRRAFAEYVRRFRLDISEIDNLGGRPYRNGYYYRRRIAEMRTKGVVDWSQGEHIGPNAELDRLAALRETDAGYDAALCQWAQGERRRRAMERIRWDVPADATHAYVVRVKLVGDQNPLEGCDFITPARLNSYGKVADPIGAAEPEKTVVTRAWRRCGLLVAAEIPELKADESAMDAGAVDVGTAVEAIAEEEDRRTAEVAARHPRQLMAAPMEAGSYDFATSGTRQSADPERVRGVQATAAHRAAAAAGASMRDPYDDGGSESSESGEGSSGGGGGGTPRDGGEGTTSSSEDSTDSADEPLERTKDEEFVCSLGDWNRHPLWHIPTSELELVQMTAASSPKRYGALAAAAASVLADRAAGLIEAPTAEEAKAFRAAGV